MRRFERYEWPGNVRELENIIERAVILTQGPSLQLEQSFGRGDVGRAAPSSTLNSGSTRLEDVERAHMVNVLKGCRWRIKGQENAAERLGLHPSTLQHRMKKLGIERPSPIRETQNG